MKLCRFGEKATEKPGLIDDRGLVKDLSGVLNDIDAENIESIPAKLESVDLSDLPVVDEPVRYGPPVRNPQKILAIGLNYSDHAEESGAPVPDEPIFFMKAVSSLNGPNDDVIIPRSSTHTDWEVELGVVIGKSARYVERQNALSHVFGYTIVHDVSERFDQLQRGAQWVKGKSHDTFSPVGPWLVTANDIGDPQDLDLFLDVNGERMQTGNTSKMIFSVEEIIAYVSRFMTLLPGDILLTGTPPGVGMGIKPAPRYIRDGDRITLGISKLGEQHQLFRSLAIDMQRETN